MIRRLTQAVACLIDTRHAAALDELTELLDENVRLIDTRHAAALDELTELLDENVRLIDENINLTAECQSLRMILKARDMEIGKLRKDFSDLVRGVVSE